MSAQLKVKEVAIIFDMDGLIIDSEPIWRKAEIDLFQSVSIFLTDNDCEQTAGLRIDEVIEYWYTRKPWQEETGRTKQDLENKIVERVIELIMLEGNGLKGIPSIFDFFKAKGIRMAIASSSKYAIINAVLTKLNIGHYFDIIYSAEDEEYGKPHPGVFLSAAKKLGVHPSNCIVFEDSFYGILAGLSARMKVVSIPAPHHFMESKYSIADIKLSSIDQFDELSLQQLI